MPLRPILATLVIAFGTGAAKSAPPQSGFERIVTADGTEIGIWYPAAGVPERQTLGLYMQEVVPGAPAPLGPHPLIVMSHGTGGDFAGHVDTAVALARAGFVVAALTHAGDNWRDSSRSTRVEERPPALSATITYMLQKWPGRAAVDPNRIGAFGFSSGGFTVLAAAGGRPDLNRLSGHCAQNPGFFDCALAKAQQQRTASPWPAMRDARIKAIVIAAPALGFTFDRAGLAKVQVPVQLWRADIDQVLPAPHYADAVKLALPRTPEFHTVPNAGHFDFLAPCEKPSSMPQICTSAPGFDRMQFHATFNKAVVAFFTEQLAPNR